MAPKYKRALTVDEYTTEKCDVIANKLLGDYNANGIYVINKKVAEELLNTKKIKKESFNNEIFCTTKTSSGRIVDFDISFKKNSQSNMAVAELYVLEGVPKQGGRMMNVLKTPIAKFTQEITPNFVDLALAKFNVGVDASDEGQEMKEVDDIYISKRTTLLSYLDKMTADNYNIVYEDFFTQRINLLKSMNNAYSKKILAIFNEEFNKVSDMFLIDKKHKKVTNFKAMNELLDKAFEDLSGLEQYNEQEKMYKEKILPILAMFIQGAERIESSSMKSVLDTVPKRLKDDLTEPLIDKKQMSESRMEPTVKETSKSTLKRELDSSMEDMADKIDKIKGKGKGKPMGDEPSPTTAPSTPTKGLATTKGPTKPVPVTEFGHESLVDDIVGDKKFPGFVSRPGGVKASVSGESEVPVDDLKTKFSMFKKGHDVVLGTTDVTMGPGGTTGYNEYLDMGFVIDKGKIPEITDPIEKKFNPTEISVVPERLSGMDVDVIKNKIQVTDGSLLDTEAGEIFAVTTGAIESQHSTSLGEMAERWNDILVNGQKINVKTKAEKLAGQIDNRYQHVAQQIQKSMGVDSSKGGKGM